MMYNPVDAIGEFQESTIGKWFTYRKTTNPWALGNGFTHEIDVLDGVRFASILKTRAYIVIDEDENGNPLAELWMIKKNSLWDSKA